MTTEAVKKNKSMRELLSRSNKIIIMVDIHEYDKKEFLNLLLNNKIAKYVLSKQLDKDQIELTFESKIFCINVCKKASDKLNKLIKEKAKGLLRKDISISKILYTKQEKGMKLEVEISEIDIDNMLDVLISSAKEGTREKESKEEQNQGLVFTLLNSINKDVSADEKIKLVQLLLGWINSNGL